MGSSLVEDFAPCPWCGAKAIDISVSGYTGPTKFMCAGDPPGHEWVDGEGPEPVEAEPEPDPYEEIAERVVQKLKANEQPNLMKRITSRLF
jgi:hypothetical protein